MDTLTYLDPDQLSAMSDDDLYALWELVPTGRQRTYQDRLTREARLQGAYGRDEDELKVVEALLERYIQSALVPIGERWVKVPPRILEAAKNDEPITAPEQVETRSTPKGGPMVIISIGGLIFLCLIAFVLMSGGGDDEAIADNTQPTLRYTLTPTPIALVESDAIIRDGDRDRLLAYPIGLQILPTGQEQPRVFIVQRRQVELAEWHYDTNPDTVSFLSDLSVRKVIGIPYTAENAALFDQLEPGSLFTLRMNTGGELQFRFEHKSQVRRSDTHIFRQLEPGLVLVLIGETGSDGLRTGERWLVRATYVEAQERSRDGFLLAEMGLPTPEPTREPTATPLTTDPKDLLHVSLIGEGVELYSDRIVIHLRIYNNQAVTVTLEPEDFRLALGYTQQPPGPWLIADNLEPIDLQPSQALDVTLIWPWDDEPFGLLEVLSHRFSMKIN